MKIDIRKALIGGGFAVTLGSGIFIGQAIADQPHMYSALSALRDARAQLAYASPNKNGHRVRALKYVDSAIYETQRGIADGRW
jgi:hypothetical protein